MFSIDRKNPSTLKLIGGPTSSEGEFPVSVAVHPEGKLVCVLNGGKINNVQCFSVDNKKGLKAVDGTHRSLKLKGLTTSPKGPAKTVSHIIFNQKGDNLLVSVKGDGAKNPGFIAAWDVKDNKLSQKFKKLTVPDGGNLPFGMTIIPDKNAILATDPAAGVEILDLSSVSSNAGKFAAKSNVVKVDNQKAICVRRFCAFQVVCTDGNPSSGLHTAKRPATSTCQISTPPKSLRSTSMATP